MAESARQHVEVKDLMTFVRAEAARRRGEKEQLHKFPINLTLPRHNGQPKWKQKPDGYHLNDFLRFHDKEFIINAYRGVLNRHPDVDSLSYYLERLRDGSQSKIEILGRLRFSPEGRAKGVRVAGLISPLVAAMLYKIPIAGGFIQMVTGVLRLPVFIKNMSRFEAYTMMLGTQYQAALNELSDKIEAAWEQRGSQIQTLYADRINPDDFNELRSHLKVIESNVEALRNDCMDAEKKVEALRNDHMDTEKKVEALRNNQIDREKQELLMEFVARVKSTEASLTLKADSNEVSQLKDDITAAMADKAPIHEVREVKDSLFTVLADKVDNREFTGIKDKIEALDAALNALEAKGSATQKTLTRLKRDVILQERRVNFILEEARKRLPEPFDSKQLKKLDSEYRHRLDALYVSFEDEYRGTREDIKERAKVYLPIIRETDAGTIERPILDIGCGRGEWLELLDDGGLTAIGIDLNRVLVQQCVDGGLTVFEGDALSYLRESPDNSFGALTGIHIIEHMSFDILVALLDECLRVLKPGGVLIFETPNPENIIVGACNFYFDPTHLRPLPPTSMEYMLETRGFLNVAVLRQNPMSHETVSEGTLPQELSFLWEFFVKEQDYAIIGYKP